MQSINCSISVEYIYEQQVDHALKKNVDTCKYNM